MACTLCLLCFNSKIFSALKPILPETVDICYIILLRTVPAYVWLWLDEYKMIYVFYFL